MLEYDALVGAAGALLLVPSDTPSLRRHLLAGRPAGPRAVGLRALRWAVRPGGATVATRASTVPAVVTRSCPDLDSPHAALVTGGGGPRRRSAFVVADHDGAPTRVVKVGRGHDADRRAAREQLVLSLLETTCPGLAPRPLGAGTSGPMAWSVEVAVAGRPLSEAVTDTSAQGRERTRRVLEDLARQLAELARATKVSPGTEPDGGLVDPTLWADLAGLPDVAGVMVHGDLASAHNVLAQGGHGRLIDWETASLVGPPLLDLLPLVCFAHAASHGARGPDAQAEHALRLCSGSHRDSPWLLGLVRSYCQSAGVPLARAGALAALAWRHPGRVRRAHDELLRTAGEDCLRWRSPAEHVARRWDSTPGLGRRWDALEHPRSLRAV